MKIILKSFLSALKSYRMTSVLNLIGLSIAFTAFYLLMVQVLFEWNFDGFHKDRDCIYRVEVTGDRGTSVCLSFPVLDQIVKSSPHIQAGGIKTEVRNSVIGVKTGSALNYIRAQFCRITLGYTKVFTFDMLEGNPDAMSNPEYAIIPLSLAEKIWGKQKSYLEKKFGDEQSWFLRVGGIYRDFPKNSIMENLVYQVPNDPWMNSLLNNWSDWNHQCFLKLDDPKYCDHLLDSLNVNLDSYKLSLRPLKDIYYAKNVQTINDQLTGNRSITLLLFSMAVLIIVIAGMNYMNFSTALIPLRIRSVNTRKVLGASNLHLRGIFVFESVMMALAGFILSVLFLFLISRSPFGGLIDGDIALSANVGLLMLTGGIAVFTGLFSSLYPAYYITSFLPALVLKGDFGLSENGRMLRNVLIGLQFFISLVVISVVLFMNFQGWYMQHESPGFDKDQLLNVWIDSKVREKQPDVFINKLKENPYIEEVGFTENAIGNSDLYMGWGRMFQDKYISYDVIPVTPNYLRVLGIRVTEGRDFMDGDEDNALGSYIFNEAAKQKYGLKLNDVFGGGTVVGFMPNIKFQSFREAVSPMCFFVWGTENWGIRSNTATIRVKAGGDMRAVAEYVKNIYKKLDPDFNGEVQLYRDMLEGLYEREYRQSFLITIFSLLAIFISVVGVFGQVTFEAQARRKEIAMRKVCGADVGLILYMFNRIYLRILLVCFVFALPVAWYIVDLWLQSFAYRIPVYLWVFGVALLIVGLVVTITVTIQSWRAANENPVDGVR